MSSSDEIELTPSSSQEPLESSQAEEVSCPSEVSTSQEPAGGVDLEELAEKDEALWPDEHSSDAESFDPENPEDLTTQNAKDAAEDDPSLGEASGDSGEGGESDEDDSCVVSDEASLEYQCSDHDACIRLAKELDAFLVERCATRSKGKERRAALAEVVCDHFEPKK